VLSFSAGLLPPATRPVAAIPSPTHGVAGFLPLAAHFLPLLALKLQPLCLRMGLGALSSYQHRELEAKIGNASTSAASAPSALEPPTFGTPGNFMSQFAKAAEETAKKDKAKRKAEEFDSDEEDEEEWECRDAEAQLAKKKVEEERENRRSTFMPGEGFSLISAPAKPVGIFNALAPPTGGKQGRAFRSHPRRQGWKAYRGTSYGYGTVGQNATSQ
jgi:hypothetical protein